MGYTTEFEGSITVNPPLNADEVSYLNDFSATRRMNRSKGPYYANRGSDGFGQDRESDILDYNREPEGQPGLWCQWAATEDGTSIEWNGAEKFYSSAEWMKYIIDHFFTPDAVASLDLIGSARQDARFLHFTFDHTFDGLIKAQGEDSDDTWLLKVENNNVMVAQAVVSYGTFSLI